MRIHWENIFGVILLVFSIYLFIKFLPFVDQWLDDYGHNYHFDNQSPTVTIMVLGLICVTVVAVTKIIVNRKR
jgi:hypothetical protein